VPHDDGNSPAPDVALISPYPRLGTRHDGDSGVASYTANLAHALVDAGARVTVVAPKVAGEPDRSKDGPIEVRRAFTSGGPLAVPAALKAAQATGAPVAHLQHELFLYSGAAGLPPTVAALAARKLARSGPRGRRQDQGARPSRQATVITMHQVVNPSAVTKDYTTMHRVAVPAPAARVAIASVQRVLPRLADQVLVHEPAFAKIISGATVVHHGIEVPAPPTESKAEVRHRLGIPADGLLAMCFGFLAPYKGLETALEAAGLTDDSVRLVVAGGEHPRLAAQGDNYGERLQQRWGADATFTGYVPDGAVADWFHAADVLLLCYPEPHASSGPLALALAHRTPVLLSQRLAETVGADPRLAVGPLPQDWADRLTELAADPDALQQLAARTEHLTDDRTWPTVARRHLDLYRGALADDDRATATNLALA
jgi:glycosyltransferase involved in cell wall biosynthesis